MQLDRCQRSCIHTSEEDLSHWWTVFNDPSLNDLICTAYHQNLTLREAGFRILQARAQLGIAVGEIFPQTQNFTADYMRIARSQAASGGTGFGPQFFNNWNFGFNLAWELDFWGQFRRAVEANADLLDASVENYDGAIVTLLGDVATNYANMRTFEQRIKYAEDNVKVQQDTLDIVEARFKVSTISELDVDQARSTLNSTKAAVEELQIGLRESITALCTLLGMPPEDLLARLGPAPIPTAPPEVAIGIPADLLRRRPDVRAAERNLAAQCAQIGIADADFYPHVSIIGTLGYSAANFNQLFQPSAFNSNVGPTLQWNLLNYFRLLNNVRLQDARFQELIATYQNTVLNANQDVENGIVTFLRGQSRTKFQQKAVDDAVKAVDVAVIQYKAGTTDFTTVTQVEQIQVQQQDVLAQAQGEIVTGLVQVYRALGGGWQIRLTNCNEHLPPCPGSKFAVPGQLESVPAPNPLSPDNQPKNLPSPDGSKVPEPPTPLQNQQNQLPRLPSQIKPMPEQSQTPQQSAPSQSPSSAPSSKIQSPGGKNLTMVPASAEAQLPPVPEGPTLSKPAGKPADAILTSVVTPLPPS